MQLIYRSNIVGIVGGGNNPRYPNNKVIMWDDYRKSLYGELSFRSQVKALRLKKEHLVIVCSTKTFIYKVANLKVINYYETSENSTGVVALCYSEDKHLLAVPGVEPGKVKIISYVLENMLTIDAHENAIQNLEFS